MRDFKELRLAWAHLRYVILPMAALLLAACGGGGDSSGASMMLPPAPGGLSYPQVPALVVGKAMASVTPAVTGTVTAYSVSPALPAGLSLNSGTGVISGTPTAIAAAANYTVTASNATGNTTAGVSITVNDVAPSISYASTSFTLTSGVLQPGLAATNSGGAALTWSISPALPAGVMLSATTGTISGTPSAVSPATSYTVTATNSGGSGAAMLTIGIQAVLVDLGHSKQVFQVRMTPARVLTVDANSSQADGTWVLWSYAAGAKIAGGSWSCKPVSDLSDAVCGGLMLPPPPADLAGPTLVDETISTGLEIRSAADGSLLGTIATPVTWWKLATDGSYVCGGTTSGLTVWSPSGAVLATRSGDYSKAVVFAAPGQVQIALGPAGANVIESVAVPSGTSTTSPAFQGTFQAWFVDGQSFISGAPGNTTVWIYSSAAVQQDIKAFASTAGLLGGEGGWFWDTEGPDLVVYAVGNSATPAASFEFGPAGPLGPVAIDVTNTLVIPAGTTIGVLPYGTAEASVIDLSGSPPVRTDFTTPVAYHSAYGALTASQWVLGTQRGVVLDGPSLATTARYFGYGAAWSIAGSAQNIAVATASGSILLFDAASTEPLTPPSLPFLSSHVALSSDGTVLAAAGDQSDAQFHSDWSINVYSLPSGSVIRSWPYSFPAGPPPYPPNSILPLDISLSASGGVLGQVLNTLNPTGPVSCPRQANSITDGSLLWSDTFTPVAGEGCNSGMPVRLSPDGTEVAVSTGGHSRFSTTNIYKNGLLTTAVPGWVAGWLDNSRILVNNYHAAQSGSQSGSSDIYADATIYGADGTRLAELTTLPELLSPQVVDANSIYDPAYNEIFSLGSGAVLWSSASPALSVGAVAGANVVFASGAQVVIQPH